MNQSTPALILAIIIENVHGGMNVARRSKDSGSDGSPRKRTGAQTRYGPGRGNSKSAVRVLTIGHSTRPIEEFISMLKAHHVDRVLDIRTIPRSRRNPQYDNSQLPESLRREGISYEHVPALGGLRRARKDSPNLGWENESFRGYADYMLRPEFADAIETVTEMARKDNIVLLCAEAVPWRCHRRLVADALLVRGVRVEHIMSALRAQEHTLTPWAKVRDTQITYPAESAPSNLPGSSARRFLSS